MRPPDEMSPVMMEIAPSRRHGAASSPCAAASYWKAAACDGAQFGHSAPASHVAPMLNVGNARSREDAAVSAGTSPPSLARIGPLRIVHEQYRELGTSGSFDEPSWSQSQ